MYSNSRNYLNLILLIVFLYSVCISSNAAISVSIESSVESLCSKASEGDTESQYLLGEALYKGKYSRSAENSASWMWLEVAANRRHTKAQSLLGRRILAEDEPNLESALLYLTSAAEKEDKDAQYTLGLMCKRQQAGLRLEDALGWFAGAAAQGHAEAIAILTRKREAEAAAAQAAAAAEAAKREAEAAAAASPIGKLKAFGSAIQHFFEVPRFEFSSKKV